MMVSIAHQAYLKKCLDQSILMATA